LLLLLLQCGDCNLDVKALHTNCGTSQAYAPAALGFYTNRFVKAGTELTFNYGDINIMKQCIGCPGVCCRRHNEWLQRQTGMQAITAATAAAAAAASAAAASSSG
jgi:hypothetical protein